MNAAEQKVLAMVAAGTITPEEGEVLLESLRREPRRSFRLLVDPFERLGALQAIGISLAVEAGCCALSRLRVRFDGAFDVHLAERAPSLATTLLDAFVSWPFVAALLFAASMILRRRGRFRDFLGAVGVSRIPLLLLGLVLAAFGASGAPLHGPLLVLLAISGLAAASWSITLLYHGFKTSSGLTGARLTVALVVTVIVAEIGSKIMLSKLAG